VAWHPGVAQRNGTGAMDAGAGAPGAGTPSPQTTGA
jgi:hypothetical protein